MKLKESEPGNLTDKIVKSMPEANTNDDASTKAEPDIHTEPLNRPMLQVEAELMLKPEPINRPAPDRESIYENPYSTNVYHNYGGTRISFRNSSSDQSGNRIWSFSCLIIGLVIGLVIGATVTGLSMQFTKTVCATLPTATSPNRTEVYEEWSPNCTEVYGESNSV